MKKHLIVMIIAFVSLAIAISCSKDSDDPSKPPAFNKQEIKAEIERLEALHVKAILQKDSVTLSTIMDTALLVNNPRNTVTVGSSGVISRLMSGELDHTSYLFKTEQILINANTAITMGSE